MPHLLSYGKFNDTSVWTVRKNQQCSKILKYIYIRGAKELLKYIPLVVFSLNRVKIIIHLSVVGEYPVVFLCVFWVLFIELGGLPTPSVTRLSVATSCLIETQVASASFCAQVMSSSPFYPASTLGLSTSMYTAV